MVLGSPFLLLPEGSRFPGSPAARRFYVHQLFHVFRIYVHTHQMEELETLDYVGLAFEEKTIAIKYPEIFILCSCCTS